MILPDYSKFAELIQENDFEHFQSLVVSDVKHESSQDVIDFLFSDLSMWLYCLQLLRKEIELQLSCQNAKMRMHKNLYHLKKSTFSKEEFLFYINKQHSWRMAAVKFLSGIERKTLYVKLLIKSDKHAGQNNT